MKRLIALLAISLLAYPKLQAAPLTLDAPINSVGTPTAVAISSTSWTKVPTSQTTGRVGVYVTSSSTNSANPIVGHIGNCTSTSVDTNVRPIQLTASSTTVTTAYFEIRDDVCLWLLSTYTPFATQVIFVQEVKK